MYQIIQEAIISSPFVFKGCCYFCFHFEIKFYNILCSLFALCAGNPNNDKSAFCILKMHLKGVRVSYDLLRAANMWLQLTGKMKGTYWNGVLWSQRPFESIFFAPYSLGWPLSEGKLPRLFCEVLKISVAYLQITLILNLVKRGPFLLKYDFRVFLEWLRSVFLDHLLRLENGHVKELRQDVQPPDKSAHSTK